MKFLPLVLRVIFCIVVDIAATKNLGEVIPLHLREFASHSFSGSIADWVLLVLFNLLMVATGIGQALELGIYEKKGSSALTILIGFVIPLILFGLIYIV